MYTYEYLKNGNNILVNSNESLNEENIEAYIAEVKKNYEGKMIENISLEFNGDEVDVKTTFSPEKFEKIRRITGYLVGTVDRFNDGKKAEEHDRVKHM